VILSFSLLVTTLQVMMRKMSLKFPWVLGHVPLQSYSWKRRPCPCLKPVRSSSSAQPTS